MSISFQTYFNKDKLILNPAKQSINRSDISCDIDTTNKYLTRLAVDHYKSNFIKVSFKEHPPLLSGFDAVSGRAKLKKQVKDRIIEPLKNEGDYLEYKVPVQKGIIFYGPSGNGKTSFVNHLVEELRLELNKPIPFFKFDAAKLEGKFVGDFPKQLSVLVDKAKNIVPAVIFIDEAERFLGQRSNRNPEWEFKADQTNEVLMKIEEAERAGIIFIAATNHIEKIDPSSLRYGRLGEQIFIGLPDKEAIADFVKMQLMLRTPGEDLAKQTQVLQHFSEQFDGLSYADIEQIVNTSAFLALKRKQQTGEHEPIQFNDLQAAFIKFKNSRNKLLEEISHKF